MAWITISPLLDRGDLSTTLLEGAVTALLFVGLGLVFDWRRRIESERGRG
ncbi:hypothetical protein [Halorientalis regularis]|nr:hypothetical protein [Halorientalis regularis]